MKNNQLKSLDIDANPFGTVDAYTTLWTHDGNKVDTMRKEAKMEITRKLIRVEGLVGLALEALRAIRRLEIAWAEEV